MTDSEVPVQVGEVYDVQIHSVGGKGDGVAKVKGFVLFIADTQKGDYVKVKITKVLPKVGFAQVIEQLDKQDAPKPKPSKFTQVSYKELHSNDREPEKRYEETDDFGSDIEDDEDF